MKDNLKIAVFFLIWMACWFGGWIAGGVLFPSLELPAMIGAAI